MKTSKIIASALLLTTLAASAVTEPGKLELTLNSATEQKMEEYQVKDKTLIKVHKGDAYVMKFQNRTAGRVLVIGSVDGLNVLDGATAKATDDGYVVGSGQTIEIKGWRASLAEVRQFVFDDKAKSYAAGTGHGSESCGVISCKVFAEKAKPQPAFPYFTPGVYLNQNTILTTNGFNPGSIRLLNGGATLAASSLNSIPVSGTASTFTSSTYAQPPAPVQTDNKIDFTLGTGWGKPVADSVQEVQFERAEELATLTIYYADEAQLTKLGIGTSAVTVQDMPKAFTQFCKEPKWVADIR